MSAAESQFPPWESLDVEYGDGDNNEAEEEVGNSRAPKPPRSKKRKGSIVWDHLTKISIDNKTYAKCNHCGKLFSGDTGTTHLMKHIVRSCPNFRLIAPGPVGSPKIEFKFDPVKSRKDYAIATIKHKYPFNMVEHEYFEKFLYSLNPDFKLPCRNTIRADVIEIHEEKKVDIYKLLNGLSCKVSVTTDIWTEDHSKVAYICFTVHYIDDNWELQKKIIAFKNFPYPHDGDTLFKFMREMILDWGLEKKLFAVVVDNASANDSMIKKLKEWLLSESFIEFDGALLHVRCSAHILNLIVQDGLNKIRGLIGKIRETVRYLNKSPAATQKFEIALNECNLENERQVAMDVPNRWNSTYDLLETALPLKEAFCRLARIDKNYQQNPSELEWKTAKVVHECLHIFYRSTQHFSGQKFPTSDVFFPDVCAIQLKLREWEDSEHDFIREMCVPMKEKFNKYWDECCVVLAVAVVFDPRLKLHIVEYLYTEIYGPVNARPYIERVRDTLTSLFIEYGGSFTSSTSVPIVSSNSSIETPYSYPDFDRWYNRSHPLVDAKSELESYLEEPRFPKAENFNILDWWKTNGPKLQILSKIARDILAVPAITVASEAAFSVGGQTIDESRSYLGLDTMEALTIDDWI